MQHTMRLNKEPFEMIKSGKKTIELRLYDEKRRMISEGDKIEFVNTSDGSQRIYCTVLKLHRFDSFKTLYNSLPLLKCGYTESDIALASSTDMEQYYSHEEEAKYGVVGIEISLI